MNVGGSQVQPHQGGPYQESIEKASTLFSRQHMTIMTIGGAIVDFEGGYLVGRYVEPFTVDSYDDYTANIYRCARWIDALPTNVPFLHAYFVDQYLTVEGCSYESSLSTAEFIALGRGARLYDCREKRWFCP